MFFRLVIVLFLAASIFSQTKTIDVFIDGLEYRLVSYFNNGIHFVSLEELAGRLSARYYFDAEYSSAEIRVSDKCLRFTDKNNFVVYSDKSDNRKIFQTSIAPYFSGSNMFIPLEIHLTSLSKVFDKTITLKKILLEEQSAIDTITERIDYNISEILIDEKANGTLIRLKSNKKSIKHTSSVQNGILFILLNDVTANPDISKEFIPKGMIKALNIQKIGSTTQIEFALNEGYDSHETFNDYSSKDLLISIHKNIFGEYEKLSDEKNKWIFDCVVIDAGHGGKDAGAIGITGVKEKDINLSIALELGKLINNNLPDVKVVYTRNDDRFVELYKRGKIANENNGKLFISIHCNSVRKNSSAQGFEIYLLRPGKTQDAIDIAEFENSVIKLEDNPDRYKKLTDENFILVTMAHSSYLKHSEKFSDILNTKLLGLSGITSRGIKQAGFYVLVGASMPGVLFETGFISNKSDEKYLKSAKGQNELALKLFDAVKDYKSYYDKIIKD